MRLSQSYRLIPHRLRQRPIRLRTMRRGIRFSIPTGTLLRLPPPTLPPPPIPPIRLSTMDTIRTRRRSSSIVFVCSYLNCPPSRMLFSFDRSAFSPTRLVFPTTRFVDALSCNAILLSHLLVTSSSVPIRSSHPPHSTPTVRFRWFPHARRVFPISGPSLSHLD